MQTISLTPDQYFVGCSSGWRRHRAGGRLAVLLGFALLGLRGTTSPSPPSAWHRSRRAGGRLDLPRGSFRRAGAVYPAPREPAPAVLFPQRRPRRRHLATLRWLYTTRFGLA